RKWPHILMSMTVSPRIQKNSTDRTPCWSLPGN
ncbi:hypothetical protein cypCar_00000574, partial [Cyprinus carpio]